MNPGIIVLVNERDIDVLQGLDTKLQDGDEVVLLSAVHGGLVF
ncbi:MAG: MoaD/ThiS family protein [Candidatus Freyarchaeota archaeon]